MRAQAGGNTTICQSEAAVISDRIRRRGARGIWLRREEIQLFCDFGRVWQRFIERKNESA